MEYSIHELSHLSGVTTRTLRWYDKIGLLKPSRVAESGYRYYGSAEVDRLQDILYYRALGVELIRIKAYLDDPSFNRLAALQSHLAVLEEEQARLEQLIESVRKTIRCEERKEYFCAHSFTWPVNQVGYFSLIVLSSLQHPGHDTDHNQHDSQQKELYPAGAASIAVGIRLAGRVAHPVPIQN